MKVEDLEWESQYICVFLSEIGNSWNVPFVSPDCGRSWLAHKRACSEDHLQISFGWRYIFHASFSNAGWLSLFPNEIPRLRVDFLFRMCELWWTPILFRPQVLFFASSRSKMETLKNKNENLAKGCCVRGTVGCIGLDWIYVIASSGSLSGQIPAYISIKQWLACVNDLSQIQ